MQSKFETLFKPSRRDILVETAMAGIDSIRTFLSLKSESGKDVDLSKAIFYKIFPNDPQSPAIYWIDESQYVIYYPPHSKPYTHSFEDKVKFIECLSGVLYDAKSDKKLFKGDRIAIFPSDNYEPYTESKKCILRICIKPYTESIRKEKLDSIWDQICN